MQSALLILSFIFVIGTASAQQLTANSSLALNNEFAFRVKIIDEFFDRFNGRKDIYLARYIKKLNPGYEVTRPQLIASLFNKSNLIYKDSIAINIITAAVDSGKPLYLNYNDTNWFALLKCSALYKGKAVKINLTMRVDHHNDGSSEWSIFDADAAFIKKMQFNPDSFLFVNNLLKYFLLTDDSTRYFLRAMSHALDFIDLNEAFKNKTKFINYAFQSKPSSSLKKLFIASIKNDFKFIRVDAVQFFMFQLPGKILAVEEFNRNGQNSGWLINHIYNIADNDKSKYYTAASLINLK